MPLSFIDGAVHGGLSGEEAGWLNGGEVGGYIIRVGCFNSLKTLDLCFGKGRSVGLDIAGFLSRQTL